MNNKLPSDEGFGGSNERRTPEIESTIEALIRIRNLGVALCVAVDNCGIQHREFAKSVKEVVRDSRWTQGNKQDYATYTDLGAWARAPIAEWRPTAPAEVLTHIDYLLLERKEPPQRQDIIDLIEDVEFGKRRFRGDRIGERPHYPGFNTFSNKITEASKTYMEKGENPNIRLSLTKVLIQGGAVHQRFEDTEPLFDNLINFIKAEANNLQGEKGISTLI